MSAKDKRPRTCLLTVTNSCVLRCKMCHLWRLGTEEREVTTEECMRFVDSFSEFGGGPIEFHLIGGESLIKKGTLDLIRYISHSGSRTVITTSGYTIDEPMAEALAGSGLSMLNLSLDSLQEDVQNYLRGRPDCFKRLMQALTYLGKYKREGFSLGINTVISAVNLESIIELTEWVNNNRDLGSIYFMAVMRPFGSNLGWQWQDDPECGFLWPRDPGKTGMMIDKLIELKRRGYKVENPEGQLKDFKSYFINPRTFIRDRRCNLAHHAVNVNALGDIYICFFMDPLGNIRDGGIRGLWESEKAEGIRGKMSVCRQNCELVVNCYYGE